ncbi:MAG: DUF3880 domain-containing protein, partial [Fibrobacterota bacterium]
MRLEIFKSASGFDTARIIGDDGKFLSLHSALSPENEGDYSSDTDLSGDIVLLLGTGLGYHVREKLRKSSDKKIIIAVDYFDDLSSRFSLEKWPDNLSVFNFGGVCGSDEIRERLKRFLKDRAPGRVNVIKHAASFKAAPGFYNDVYGAFIGLTSPGVKEKARPYIDNKRRLLLLKCGSYLEKEIAAAAPDSGTEIDFLDIPKNPSAAEAERLIRKKCEEFHPSFVLSINANGLDNSGAAALYLKNAGIPYVIWFVDDPGAILFGEKKLSGINAFAFTWDSCYLEYLRECGFNNAGVLPLAGSPHYFSHEPATPENLEFDCTFVGNISRSDIKDRFNYVPESEGLALHAAKVLSNPGNNETAGALLEKTGFEKYYRTVRGREWFKTYIVHQATELKRKSVLAQIDPGLLTLFGRESEFRELFGSSVKTRPDVNYYDGLSGVYNRSAVNINITSSQMVNAVNQRVFDV